MQKKYRNKQAIEEKLNTLQYEIQLFKQEIDSLKKNKSKNKFNYNIDVLTDMLKNFGDQYTYQKVY